MSTIKVTNLQNASAASPAIVLDANSRATLNGLSYPTEGSLSGRNRIINGDHRINQRNATQTVNDSAVNFYATDRWYGSGELTDGVFTLASNTTAPAGFTNSLLATVTTADASIGALQRYVVAQRIEGNNIADLAWGTASAKTVTLSFWIYSSLTGTFGGAIRNSAGDRSYPFSYTISAANTWEYKTVTITGDTSGTWLTDNGVGIFLAFSLGAGSSNKGTAGAWSGSSLFSVTGAVDPISTNGSTWRITGVQLEAGSVATPFERRSYGQELALCQRYYYNIKGEGELCSYIWAYESNTYPTITIQHPVTMRVGPTVTSTKYGSGYYITVKPTIYGTYLGTATATWINTRATAIYFDANTTIGSHGYSGRLAVGNTGHYNDLFFNAEL